MMTLDAFITIGIVVAAAAYLFRKFSRSGKAGACGCASGGGCCGTADPAAKTHCCSSKH